MADDEKTFPEIMKKEEITKRSDDSAWMLPYWDQTDAIVEGYKAVRDAAEEYLPKFEEESTAQYNNRLKATKFTNIYRDIIESLAAKPFEEEVSFVDEVSDDYKSIAEDIDGSGNNLTVFAAATFFNAINSAIDWIFVDYPKVDSSRVRTQRDVQEQGIRPFWSHVLGRNVLEVTTKVIASKEILTYMRIMEFGKTQRIRIFNRDETTGTVTFYLYEEIKDDTNEKGNYRQIDFGIITIGVIPLVPVITGRRNGRTFKIYPAMRDAADLQIELYQQESALKFAKTMTAYPMLSGNGVNPERNADGSVKPIQVGPNKVLYSPPDGSGNVGSWTYVEPSAQSLTFLAGDIKDTKQDLRELGRQPLTAQSGNLTVITTAYAAGKSKSAVAAWANGTKDALENAFYITTLWLGKAKEESPAVRVFDDFDSFMDGDGDLEHLRSLRDKGDLSRETLWNETKRRGVLSSEFDPEAEEKLLLAEIPGDDLTGEGNEPPDPENPADLVDA